MHTRWLRCVLFTAVIVLLLNGNTPSIGLAHSRQSATPFIFQSAPGGPYPIPDGVYDGTPSSMLHNSITVSGVTAPNPGDPVYLGVIKVTLRLDHARVGDLVVKLVSPSGRSMTLLSRPGINEWLDDGSAFSDECPDGILNAAAPCYNPTGPSNPLITVIFDDGNGRSAEKLAKLYQEAPEITLDCRPDPGATFSPPNMTSAFSGDDPNGIWTLLVSDAVTGETGSLISWGLNLTTLTSTTTSLPLTDSGLTFAIQSGGLPPLIQAYGADAPLIKVLHQVLSNPVFPAGTFFQTNAQSFLNQMHLAGPEITALTLKDLPVDSDILINDSAVTVHSPEWVNLQAGTQNLAGGAMHYITTPESMPTAGEPLRTPNRDRRGVSLFFDMVTYYPYNIQYSGFASFSALPPEPDNFYTFLPMLTR